MLACSSAMQTELELVLGEPDSAPRHEVVYRDGVPMLRSQPAGQAVVTPWPDAPVTLPIPAPVVAGQDRLRLRFSINRDAELTVEWQDLVVTASETGESPSDRVLALGMVR